MHMHTLLAVTPWDQTLKTLTYLSECVTSNGLGGDCIRAPSNAVVSKCYNAMMKASTAGHTGPSTPWGLCVMEMARGAVERRLTRPIFNWSAVPGGWGFA